MRKAPPKSLDYTHETRNIRMNPENYQKSKMKKQEKSRPSFQPQQLKIEKKNTRKRKGQTKC